MARVNSGSGSSYLTVNRRYGPEEIRIRGSRFISFLYPVSHPSQSSEILNGLRKDFHDASHVCFAYRLLGDGREQIRYYDDREPSGTAGLPIYNRILSGNLMDVLVAVVRYFGGTKLGTGGLKRAYGQSAERVLSVAEKLPRQILKRFFLEFEYSHTGEVMAIMERFDVSIENQNYSQNGVMMELGIPESRLADLTAAIRELGRGKIKIEPVSG